MAASLVKFTKTLWEAILQTELVTVNGLLRPALSLWHRRRCREGDAAVEL
jgi:hypothetical protein